MASWIHFYAENANFVIWDLLGQLKYYIYGFDIDFIWRLVAYHLPNFAQCHDHVVLTEYNMQTTSNLIGDDIKLNEIELLLLVIKINQEQSQKGSAGSCTWASKPSTISNYISYGPLWRTITFPGPIIQFLLSKFYFRTIKVF